MVIVEIIMLVALGCLGCLTSISDIRRGIIPNRIIALFGAVGLTLDIVYYGLFSRDTFLLFGMNILLVILITGGLYITHSLAGGDCKLIPVMGMLYPAGMYLTYGNTEVTLFATILIAIFYGYLYLLVLSVWKILSGETRIGLQDIRSYLLGYLQSYLTASIYVTFANLIFATVDRYIIEVSSWIVWIVCISVAWVSGRVKMLRKPIIMGAIIVIDIALSIYLKVLPFSINARTYIFTAVLVMCQMTIRTNVYETISTFGVKKGMILSTFSSMLMQNSRVKGLPGVSSEDLRDRLSEDEAESVRRWGKTPKGQNTIAIVKKIPFAVFIAMGYLTYLVVWSVIR